MSETILKLGMILTDRGSESAVSGAPVTDRAGVDRVLKSLKREKAYAKATHNTWAALLSVSVASQIPLHP